MNVLLVEDKSGMRDMLTRVLSREGYEVTACEDGRQAMDHLLGTRFDMVLTDLKMPGADGFEVLRAARAADAEIPVVVMTAHGSIEAAVSAMRDGAFDFITKPFDPDHLTLLLEKAANSRRMAVENRVLKRTARHQGAPDLIGESGALAIVREQVARVANTDTTVLLTGESGTGKELFAQLVHASSPRKDGPFIAVNCAAVPAELLESEFFGHEKGAFTGAEGRRIGQFELAQGGTIFLDEIGDMDLVLQAKLLRVLQEGCVTRVGGGTVIPLDVRVVAATNQDLPQRVQQGRFREDLYYRLSGFPILIPPLREREGDPALLAAHFVARYAREMGRPVSGFSAEALAQVSAYDWPGNVRELQNCVERSVILATGDTIAQIDVAASPGRVSQNSGPHIPLDRPLQEVAADAQSHYETACIRRALDLTGGNKTRAAEVLGVSYKTLLSKIKDYNIEPSAMPTP